MLFPPWLPCPPPSCGYPEMIILRAGGLTEWKKPRANHPPPCPVKTRETPPSAPTQAFLFAGGTSVNRWQSPSLSCRTCCRNAEMQPWLLQLQPPSRGALGQEVGERGGASTLQPQAAGTKNWIFADLGKKVLPEAFHPPQFFPFTGMLPCRKQQ